MLISEPIWLSSQKNQYEAESSVLLVIYALASKGRNICNFKVTSSETKGYEKETTVGY